MFPRNFKGESLGVSFTPKPAGRKNCGICSKNHLDQKSYNTGFVNFCLRSDPLHNAITQHSFRHEIGHSFGSPHDPSRYCPADRGVYTK